MVARDLSLDHDRLLRGKNEPVPGRERLLVDHVVDEIRAETFPPGSLLENAISHKLTSLDFLVE